MLELKITLWGSGCACVCKDNCFSMTSRYLNLFYVVTVIWFESTKAKPFTLLALNVLTHLQGTADDS